MNEPDIATKDICAGPVISLQEPFIISGSTEIICPNGYIADKAEIIAEAGDLAVGVLDAEDGNLIGWSFLTGEASGLIAFAEDFQPDIEESLAAVAFLDVPDDISDIKKWRTALKRVVKKAKYGLSGIEAFVFRIDTDDMAMVKPLYADIISAWAAPFPKDWVDEHLPLIPHLLGIILGPDEDTLTMHMQPPLLASERSADALGILLLADAVEDMEEGEK